MSLDIILRQKKHLTTKCYCPHCDNEHDHVHNPVLWEYNITHNLVNMADKCGLYKVIWRPEEENIQEAQHMIPFLKEGIDKLMSEPEYYRGFNPKNGWGSYEGFLKFCQEYLDACKQFPDSKIYANG